MGLFSRSKEGTTATTTVNTRDGWMAQCAPQCGFQVKDHDQKETAQMVMLHMKQTHKTNLTDAEAMKEVKPLKF